MGQGLDILGACSDNEGARRRAADRSDWDEDSTVGCAALEENVKSALASANRGGNKLSGETLLNHELLQYARQGNATGLSKTLAKGAWTETRRPLVMKPQKPDGKGGDKEPVARKGRGGCGGGGGVGGGGGDADQPEIGMTPLMFSAQSGSVECIRRLLWASAEVNAVEEDGWTALHFASKECHLGVCEALMQGRADVGKENSDDKTALEVAREEDPGFAEKLELLLRHG